MSAKHGAAMWDERFSGEIYAYGTEPNVWVAEQVAALAPAEGARALVPADGEGRNAVWLASQGWAAEVFDLSQQGRAKAMALAEHCGVSIQYNVADLVEVAFEEGAYDLIAFSWFHVPSDLRAVHFPRMLHALSPGGHFICEGYHTSQMPMSSGGPKSLDLLWDLPTVLEELTGPHAPPMRIVEAAVTSTVLEESWLHEGLARVVRLHLVRES